MDRLQQNMILLGSQLSDKFAVELYPRTKEGLDGFPLKHPDWFDAQAVADAAAFAVLQGLTTITERTARTGLSPYEANVATMLAFKVMAGVGEGFTESMIQNCMSLLTLSRAEQELLIAISVQGAAKPE